VTARSISASPLPDRSGVQTEQPNERSRHLDQMSIAQCVQRINEEDATAAIAVGRAQDAIVAFIEGAAERMRKGGRLIYVGAGTSGRLGALDAAECPPTFQTPESMVIGLIAGGDAALRRSSEAREDEWDGCHSQLASLNVGSLDSVLGIAAGGTTPYVLGAVAFAKGAGALTGTLSCSPVANTNHIDHAILIETGPEVVAGSTRMKAGAATKMALHTISTTIMVQIGKVYDNLMVDVRTTSDKLHDRAARIVVALTDLDRNGAIVLLGKARGDVKTAVVMHRSGLSRDKAGRLLDAQRRNLRAVLETLPGASPEVERSQ